MSEKIIQPPMIRYNLKERGRKYRGVERDFDIPAIVAAINSPECQELVKTRGMLGYLGHWVRIRFGLDPSAAEGGIVQGKAYSVEAAIVTTYLRAYPNGDIEHQTEFLDTHPGRIAARMFANKIGGFSSAIDEIDVRFYGFDWVNDPNYSTNRGYGIALDSVSNGTMSLQDIMAAEMHDQTEAMAMLLMASEKREKIALDSASALRIENDQFLELLAQSDFNKAPSFTGNDEQLNRMKRDKAVFDSTYVLPRFEEPVNQVEQQKQDQANHQYNQIANRYRF